MLNGFVMRSGSGTGSGTSWPATGVGSGGVVFGDCGPFAVPSSMNARALGRSIMPQPTALDCVSVTRTPRNFEAESNLFGIFVWKLRDQTCGRGGSERG